MREMKFGPDAISDKPKGEKDSERFFREFSTQLIHSDSL